MDKANEFYTFKGYQTSREGELTPAMEDYLEMIYRLLRNQAVVRIGELSDHLHVKPSSASKIVQTLKELDYIEYEKYGYILLTEKGQEEGAYLLYRHEVLERFLCLLNNTSTELEQVENLEHFVNRLTVENLRRLTDRLGGGLTWPS
ncbi:MAG: metal-dependent transcriptional regulator [Lachnospiraceae bacterium]|nr:metal-dependent transcriptional regulator [Lachnospiraceae bacterium]